MPAGEQADEDTLHHVFLPDDYFPDLFPNCIQPPGGKFETCVGSHVIIVEQCPDLLARCRNAASEMVQRSNSESLRRARMRQATCPVKR